MKNLFKVWHLILPVLLLACEDGLGSDYAFKQMWPKLEQPWFFDELKGVAVDSFDNVYLIDSFENQVRKFNSTGVFITKWGGQGNGSGKFLEAGDIAVDASDNVYVLDWGGGKIQKFSPDGTFLTKWGTKGDGPGQFKYPRRLAIGPSGEIFVVDTDHHRVMVFTQSGTFVSQWGGKGAAAGQLDTPTGMAVDSAGIVYVADAGSKSVKKYTGDGTPVGQWDIGGSADTEMSIDIDAQDQVYISRLQSGVVRKYTSNGQFLLELGNVNPGWPFIEDGYIHSPSDVVVDSKGSIWVTDFGGFCLHKFSSGGGFTARWESRGTGQDRLYRPGDIAADLQGQVYVADSNNDRIQIFTSDMALVSQWGSTGPGNGEFWEPVSIAVNTAGEVFVLERLGQRIQKFTSDGAFITKWGKEGQGPGEFFYAEQITVDAQGNVYVADVLNHRVQKFTSDGVFITQWGTKGTGNGQFTPCGVAVDSKGVVYVTDGTNDNFRIQTFTSNGAFIASWGNSGTGDGELDWPGDIFIDSQDHVFVADRFNYRFQVFSPDGDFISSWGGLGSDPGQFNRFSGIAVSGSGDVYTTDSYLNRIQVFTPQNKSDPNQSKAIVVAGGGGFPGNNLWDATQLCANYAYRALTYQGYTKETIRYLSSDTDLDLDSNGIPDDVDGDATKINLKNAVTSWAADADDLVVYLTDHGGYGKFRMNETELLSAQELDDWLNQHQAKTGSEVTLVYDACMAGSFLDTLASPSHDRIFIASSLEDQQAHFTSTGQVSFSYYFWGGIFNGMSIYDAFLHSQDAVNFSYTGQSPVLNADANAVGNEYSDMQTVKGKVIGNGVVSAEDIPVVGSVSGKITLNGGTQATIVAKKVVDANGISRVWAVITPPDSVPADPSQPVTALPEIEFKNTSGTTYQGSYDGFTKKGTYHVAVFALDKNGVLSIPKSTSIVQAKGPGYATLNAALEMSIPCIASQGGFHQVVLEYYPYGPGKSIPLWKTASSSDNTNQVYTSDCASTDTGLKLKIPKIEFGGFFYQAVLEPYANPLDPFGQYWTLYSASLL